MRFIWLAMEQCINHQFADLNVTNLTNNAELWIYCTNSKRIKDIEGPFAVISSQGLLNFWTMTTTETWGRMAHVAGMAAKNVSIIFYLSFS